MTSVREPLNRAAIVAAARELVVKDGVESVSLRRVASALGVTAPALYAHVTHKHDLLEAVAEAEFQALIERFDAVSEVSPLDRMRAYSRAYIDHARDNPELFHAMFLFQPRLASAEPTGTELPAATKAFAMPAAAVADAMDSGLIAGADPVLAALTTWAAVHGAAMVLQLGFAFDRATEDALVESVIEMMITGLSCDAATDKEVRTDG
jgi:AcrR family transcriptional regulator